MFGGLPVVRPMHPAPNVGKIMGSKLLKGYYSTYFGAPGKPINPKPLALNP